MTAMAFWSKSSAFTGWRKAHFVDGAWHTTACATSKTLEVLPPLDWQGTPDSQSFKLMEMYSGNITDIFAQYGTRFFQLRHHVMLTHEEIMVKVRAFIADAGAGA